MNVTASRIPPSGSKWAIGLSVSRPNSLAVPSPRRYAARAWLNSWTGNPTSSMIATAMTIGQVWLQVQAGSSAAGPAYGSRAAVRWPRAPGSEPAEQLRLLALVLLGR